MRDKGILTGGLPAISIEDILNRFVLIVGEVNRGKTTLTGRIFELYRQGQTGPVTVVDLAPSMALMSKTGPGIGGRLSISPSPGVRYFYDRIRAPRLESKDEREALALAEENRRMIESLFEKAFQENVKALFVNDCSLYLHAGDPKKMLQWVRAAGTSVLNGYYGESLGPGPVTEREKAGMEYLMKHCDRLIRL
jgi:hypothetical protein